MKKYAESKLFRIVKEIEDKIIGSKADSKVN